MSYERGPWTTWLFRYKFPHPEEHEKHAEWVDWLKYRNYWPTQEMIATQQYEMLFPPEWRSKAFKDCVTLEDFWRVKSNKRSRNESWGVFDWSNTHNR